MNSRSLGALVALNLVLLAALLLVTLTPRPAEAQMGLAPAQYTMIAGEVTGRNSQSMVYIIELNTGNVAAVIFNSANNNFDVIAVRELSRDFAAAAGAR